jgi:anti-anti-sigma regulatory factor
MSDHPASSIDTQLAAAVFTTSSTSGPCVMRHVWRDNCLVLEIKGSSSTNFSDEFTDAVANLFRVLKPRRAAVDLSGTDHLPSVMLAFLVYFQKNAAEHGCAKVVLYGASARITTMIRMIGMADFFHNVPDADAAKAWFDSIGA